MLEPKIHEVDQIFPPSVEAIPEPEVALQPVAEGIGSDFVAGRQEASRVEAEENMRAAGMEPAPRVNPLPQTPSQPIGDKDPNIAAVRALVDSIPTNEQFAEEHPFISGFSLLQMAKSWGSSVLNLMEAGKGEREATVADAMNVFQGPNLLAGKAYPVGSLGIFGSRLHPSSSVAKELERVTTEFQLNYGRPIHNFPEEALKRAGLSKDVHGNWVKEIDDSKARLSPELATGKLDNSIILGNAKLPDVLDHPDLFEAFPYLKNVRVQDSGPSENFGSYHHDKRLITINGDLNEQDLIDTLLHETQHAVQATERDAGMRRSLGTNPEYTQLQYERFLDIVDKSLTKGAISREEAQSIHRFISSIKTEYDAYLRNPGEVEARNVMARRQLGEQERRAISPEATEDVPRAEQLDLDTFEEVYRKAQTGHFSASMRAPDFYSGLERAVDKVKMESAPAEQWLDELRTPAGVGKKALRDSKTNKPTGEVKEYEIPKKYVEGLTQEEMEWSGLEKWLEGKKGEKVGKEEVRKFLKENGTEIKEIQLGEKITPERQAIIDLNTELINKYGGLDEAFEKMTPEENQRFYDIHDTASRNYSELKPTKFQGYQLPGGENYREVLYTLPPEQFEKPLEEFGGQTPFSERFTSSHWNEPNVLAHTRVNDRVIDGKKTLFVEEVQSDWHQKGREQGYKENVNTEGWSAKQDADSKMWEVLDSKGKSRGHLYAVNEAKAIKIASYNTNGVPNAPFKRTWPDLVLKRLVRDAVKNGDEQIAWTSGATQAERYDLSKQVEKLSVLKGANDTFTIEAIPKGHGVDEYMTVAEGIKADKLADHVGKELAEKIAKQTEDEQVYSGLDLKVGGEGMKGFYDKMLPSIAKKLFGKDGVEIKTMKLNEAPKPLTVAEENSARRLEDRIESYDFSTTPLAEKIESALKDDVISEEEAAFMRDYLKRLDYEPDVEIGKQIENPTVHVMTITPALRSRILNEGQSLFADGVPLPGESDDE